MQVISKELLSEVLGKDANFHKYIEDRSVVLYIQDIADCREINLYELAHKCKEWAKSKGYYLTTKQHKDGFLCYVNLDFTIDLSHKKIKCNLIGFDGLVNADTEFLAVKKACEWIQNNIK